MGQQASRPNRQPPAGDSPQDVPTRRSNVLRPVSGIFNSVRHRQQNDTTTESEGSVDQRPSTSIQPRPPPSFRRTSSRITRARDSISASLPSLLNRSSRVISSSTLPSPQSHNDFDLPTAAPELPPHQHIPSLDLDFDPSAFRPPSPPHRPRRPSPHPRRSSTNQSVSRSFHRNPATTMADRIQSLTPDRGFRSLVRRRRTPPQTEDNAAVLARMLAVAAAATAASLMGGNSEEAVHNLRNASPGIDGDDGTFDRFLQTLRSGRLAQRLGAHALEQTNGTAPNNGMAFFRVFRFAQAAQQQARRDGQSALSRPSTANNNHPGLGGAIPGSALMSDDTTENRMVPVLMIGIRSLSESSQSEGIDAMPSFLDALTNFPAVNMDIGDQAGPEEIANEATTQATTRTRRRASMGGLGFLSGSSRRNQTSPDSSRPISEIGPSSTGSNTPLMPYPPPTTPSSRPLSALSSESSTPSRRASVSSNGTPTSATPRREHFRQNARTALESTAEEPAGSPRPTRARRLSESDFMRYGSGSARRNGVVEPDNSGGNRSWIIYVLGGSYPENHPILMAPSLFTDSPTYEDMMLLSSMLGPAKPPVASNEDVDSAGGLVRFELVDGNTVAVPDDGSARVVLSAAERCLVCLCDYSTSETGRRLEACGHLFHQECIDQWLTTGRNSCPLCRRQGVEEKSGGGVETTETVRPPSPSTPNYIRTPDGR